MPLQQTSGNVTQDAYGGGVSGPLPTYVENVFSTYLYTGTGSNQTITNNIDLADNGGMVWTKNRTTTGDNSLFDTVQGIYAYTSSNKTATEGYSPTTLRAFNNNGFGIGTNSLVNTSSQNYVSWTFRKQIKFFDIVNYIGTGSAHAINHNLGSVPGCIMIKDLNNTTNWTVYHSGLNNGSNPQNYYINLNTTGSQTSDSTVWNNTVPTSTQFTVGTSTNVNNGTNGNYIAYIFGAGGTGGFGLTGTQDIISCGVATANSSGGFTVNLGWEPQWVLTKKANGTGDWNIFDTMRGFSQTQENLLFADSSGAEVDISGNYNFPIATGFQSANGVNSSGDQIIYIAIRRGPMATPTTGTSVYSPQLATPSVSSTNTVTTNFVNDLTITTQNNKSTLNQTTKFDRLTGTAQNNASYLVTNTTASEVTGVQGLGYDNNTGFVDNFSGPGQGITTPTSYWNFARAPGFFDVVCYTGTLPLNSTSSQTVNHNLTVVPQLLIGKSRTTNPSNWIVCFNMNSSTFERMSLNLNASTSGATTYGNYRIMLAAQPTATQVFFGSSGNTSNNLSYSGDNYVLYLFATVPGVSYVGSYTGTGATQSIACGFGAGGARFILAKRTDSTGDWYCWDSADGLTSSSSPYLQWDTQNAQVTGNNGTYASSGGFTLTSASPVNTSGGTFIFLSIA